MQADNSKADSNEIVRAAALDFGHRLAAHCQEVLRTDLLGISMIGSATQSGFSIRVSARY